MQPMGRLSKRTIQCRLARKQRDQPKVDHLGVSAAGVYKSEAAVHTRFGGLWGISASRQPYLQPYADRRSSACLQLQQDSSIIQTLPAASAAGCPAGMKASPSSSTMMRAAAFGSVSDHSWFNWLSQVCSCSALKLSRCVTIGEACSSQVAD
jgi:hypothetical protein